MAKAVHTVDDWSDEDFAGLLDRAGSLADGAAPRAVPGALVGMCFFQTSLRTRVGFEAAAHRIGAGFVEAVERRGSTDSMPESIDDTIRVMSGYCDALVVRAGHLSSDLHRATRPGIAWVNAGDSSEHPTQALIDMFAIERLSGPVVGLRIAIVGDPRMRSVRSLLSMLARRAPAAMTIVTDARLVDDSVPPAIPRVAGVGGLPEFEPDIVYLAGIPHRAVPEAVRTRLRLDRATLERLPSSALVLSPLPLIDEVAFNARDDPRVRWFEQSDLALHARMAVLESVLE